MLLGAILHLPKYSAKNDSQTFCDLFYSGYLQKLHKSSLELRPNAINTGLYRLSTVIA